MSDWLQHVADRWRNDELLNPALPTGSDIASFEATHGVVLSPDTRRYFRTLNGTRHGAGAGIGLGLTAFWHFDQLEVPHVDHAPPDRSRHWFYFADWCIECHRYMIGLSADGSDEPVAIDTDGRIVAPSLASFFEMCLEDGTGDLPPPGT